MLEAGQEFEWCEKCENSFRDLKTALTGEEVMAYPNDDGLYILDTDASNRAVGSTLSQMQWSERLGKEIERPIIFASKSLSKSQRQYCVTKEGVTSRGDICAAV